MAKFKIRIMKYRFMFEELVSRDFKEKYKRTILGMAWSILSPLLMLLVMRLVFTQFFGRNTPHYTTYLFCGNLVMSYFREATKSGMSSLTGNSKIIEKINVPKVIFLLSKNVSALINFMLTLLVFFLFCILDGIRFGPHFFMLLFPVLCLVIFNIGVGLVLSAWYVFFKDISYLYEVFLRLLTYLSAIFYRIDDYPAKVQQMFLLNPVYCYIKYFRVITIEGDIPSLQYHALCAFYALVMLFMGLHVYKKNNHKFIYYL